ncbi:DNA-directed RNA polymerase subunit alpha C-terminal domain-containing protein [Paenibacillus sp. FSL E2-8871]|uniref:DNA-directed RNA polymerase subunit alpha C-terminal domain-containing protein n=1 Tax=Paenibacillus sp. FSL E2-8871 TaxID=2975326 RepID=UPI0030FC3FCB
MKQNVSLKFLFPVPKVFHPFPIHFLRIAATDSSNKSISRILNSLQENKYSTIDDVLNTTMNELTTSRNFGKKGLTILFDLLENISRKPELILETNILEQPLRDKIERIKKLPLVKHQLLELGIEI